MSDVFLSYKRDADKGRAATIRAKLEALGVEVFQDIDMAPGGGYHAMVDDSIKSASAMLVLWTKASIPSSWVIAEADKGRNLGILVSASFDGIDQNTLPVPFNSLQTQDLTGWIETGAKASHPSWRNILKALAKFVGRPLVKLAEALDSHDPQAKVEFIRAYPNDPSAIRLANEIKAIRQIEFDHQMEQAREALERHVTEANQQLNAVQEDFDKRSPDSLLATGADGLDPLEVVAKIANRSVASGSGRLQARVRDVEAALAEANGIIESQRHRLDAAQRDPAANAPGKGPLGASLVWWTAAAVVIVLLAGSGWMAFRQRELNGALAAARQDTEELRSGLADATAKALSLADQKKALDALLESARGQLDQAKTQAASASDRVQALTKDVAALSSERATLQNERDSANERAAALGKDNARLADESAAAQSQLQLIPGLKKAASEIAVLKDSVEASEKKLKSGAEQLNSANDRVGELTKEVAALSTERTSLLKERDAASQRATSLAGDNAGLAGELAKARDELQSVPDPKDATGKIAALNDRIEATEKDLKAAAGQLKSANEALKSREDQLKSATEQSAANASQLKSARVELSDLQTKYDTLGKQFATLKEQNSGFQTQIKEAAAREGELGRKRDELDGQLSQARRQVQDSQASLAQARSDAAAVRTSLERAQASLTRFESLDSARGQSEDICNELAGYARDADLPANAKRASGTSRTTADKAIDSCWAALSSQPVEYWRRIVFQLGRSYISKGYMYRPSDPLKTTDAFDTAVSLLDKSAEAGSVSASFMLGWIYHGGLSPDDKSYLYPGTPDHARAWPKFKAAADAKDRLGLVAAAMYEIWPDCYPGAPKDRQKEGLGYLDTALAAGGDEAHFLDSFMAYYGTRASSLSKAQAGKMMQSYAANINDAAREFAKRPPERPLRACPPDIIH